MSEQNKRRRISISSTLTATAPVSKTPSVAQAISTVHVPELTKRDVIDLKTYIKHLSHERKCNLQSWYTETAKLGSGAFGAVVEGCATELDPKCSKTFVLKDQKACGETECAYDI